VTRKRIGPQKPVRVISAEDLSENGGNYQISGNVAVPISVDENVVKAIGGPISDRVYIITQAEIDSGKYKLQGGPAQKVVDSSLFVPSRKQGGGRDVTPVYILYGSLGDGGTEGQATDEDGQPLIFDSGEPYVYSDLPSLPEIDSNDTSPADDFLHMWDSASNGAKKVLIRDFSASISRIQRAYFRVYRSSEWNISDNAWLLFNWTTTEEDSHSGVSLASNRYTVPSGQAGLWWFHCLVSLSPWAYTRARFSINNAAKFMGFDTGPSGLDPESDDATEAIFYWDMNEGDYIDVDIYHHQGQNVKAGAQITFFEGAKIGPPLT